MPPDTTESEPSTSASAAPAGTEPLACVSCRARKLKCDRTKPACSRCVKVSNECVYPESRRKPTFKRRNVKELEARLAQVEDYLKEVNKNSEDKTDDGSPIQPAQPEIEVPNFTGVPRLGSDSEQPQMSFIVPNYLEQPDATENTSNTQLMGLGMTESLPPDEVMEELNTTFFQHQYQMIPIVHPGRYLQAFYGPPLRKPPMCLQYIIWALAAVGHAKYNQYHEVFYRRARQYIEADEMKGHGEVFVSINHAQSWCLIAFYEAKVMLFSRSTMSGANCVRLCHMIGLDRLDGERLGMPPPLPPALTWAELEERRRVFWGAFSIDAHCCISTGWPSLINKDDVATRLPSSEDAFLADREEEAPFLTDAFRGARYTGFAGTVITCEVFKSILRHVHNARPDDGCDDVMNGTYWTRHRELDNTLSSLFMFLPEKFRMPENIRDASATHLNLNLHASIICLHHAAIEKVEKHGLPDHIKQNSIARLRAAAEEVVNIIRINTHATLFFRSPLCALSLYCTTTVYVYLAKQNPTGGLTSIDLSNLDLIIQAMEAIARTHTITRAFLQQACLDIEHNGLNSSIRMPSLKRFRNAFGEGKSHIPMLVRSAVAKHTEQSSLFFAHKRTLDAEQEALDKLSTNMDRMKNHRPASSPANQCSGARTVSGSSHTSPDNGLGNTAEENRIDLRSLQGRVATPIWQSTEETLFAQITETMITNALPSDGTDPWGILNADLNWDAEGMPTGL
ncbi:hypothetical protein CEP54_008728 [Fusarium duplospermum]|uniref:Zn(2)-C6 fungal-type domain-containing protein n=1 Tax=Fusarium duplospermum TaxID=1325734 RepID=A0A428PUG5_9HYPO|nr:hypothetical protein CEP54_008728 [Fusarium duplospermum]